jgi:hypothetical protein
MLSESHRQLMLLPFEVTSLESGYRDARILEMIQCSEPIKNVAEDHSDAPQAADCQGATNRPHLNCGRAGASSEAAEMFSAVPKSMPNRICHAITGSGPDQTRWALEHRTSNGTPKVSRPRPRNRRQ